MKYIYIAVALLLAACSAGKNSTKTSQDKDLLSAIKKLDREPSNTELKNTVATLYNNAAKSHLDKIEVYNTLTETDRWDKIIREYEALKNLSETVSNSAVVAKLINPPSYTNELQVAKQSGAKDYYDLGVSNLNIGDKESARTAYRAFKKVNEFVPGYKDANQQLSVAYKNSIVKVVINPVRDNTLFYNSMGWNNFGNNFNNDYFQRSLVNDLGGTYSKSLPAKFYTDWDARRDNITPDWTVDLTWNYLNIPQPTTSQITRNISKQIETGRDTAGKATYQTVYATLYIEKRSFTASGDMDVTITDLSNGKNIISNRYSDQYTWQEETATYSGDVRALGNGESGMLNRNYRREPRKEDILNELSRRIYPQIKSRIYNVVSL
jgi:hypothetical protein